MGSIPYLCKNEKVRQLVGIKMTPRLTTRGRDKAQLRFPDPLTLEWTLVSGECGVTHDFGVDSIEQMQFTP